MKITVLIIWTRVYEKNPEELKKLIASEEEPSLSDLVQVKFFVTTSTFPACILFLKLCPSGLVGEDPWAWRRVQLSGEVINLNRLHLPSVLKNLKSEPKCLSFIT